MANPLDPDDDMQRRLLRKSEASAKGGHAFQRLLHLTETRESGQVRRVASFIAATYNGEAFPFDLFELRAVTLRSQGSAGVAYDSVRRPPGQCAAIFKPKALSNARAVGHIGLHWDGRAISHWFEKGAPRAI